jgi:hypothetical protein
MGYETNSGGFFDKNGWFNLAASTGYSVRRIPLAIREPDEGLTHCDSIVAAVHDPACDPRSGGLVGTRQIAPFFDMQTRPFQRYVAVDLRFLRWLAEGIPVSHVNSIAAAGTAHRARVRRENLARLGIEDSEA